MLEFYLTLGRKDDAAKRLTHWDIHVELPALILDEECEHDEDLIQHVYAECLDILGIRKGGDSRFGWMGPACRDLLTLIWLGIDCVIADVLKDKSVENTFLNGWRFCSAVLRTPL